MKSFTTEKIKVHVENFKNDKKNKVIEEVNKLVNAFDGYKKEYDKIVNLFDSQSILLEKLVKENEELKKKYVK